MTGRVLPPAGAPIRISDLARWAVSAATHGTGSARLCSEIVARFGVRHCFPINTGRAGLTVILRVLASLESRDRREVIVPAYTCYSVAASAVKAGLRVRIVDVDRDTLDYDPDALAGADFRRVLAIVSTSLYGLPANLPRAAAVAKAHGVYLIDDAAQAMGARIDDRHCGTFGDVGLFSFDKGKALSAIEGGAIVTSSGRIASALEALVSTLPARSATASVEHLAKLGAYALLLHPSLYRIPNSIPWLGLGQTRYTTDIEVTACSQGIARLAATMLARLDAFTTKRIRNAQRLRAALENIPGIRSVAVQPGACPTYVRYPVLFEDVSMRRLALEALGREGLGASVSYPGALSDIPGLQPHLAAPPDTPVARAVAQRIVTLPTHPYVTDRDIDRIGAVLHRLASAGVTRATPSFVH